MPTYKITIKDNSIPEHMQKAIPNFHNEYSLPFDAETLKDLYTIVNDYIHAMATELDTDPESLEILSIIKQ